LATSPIFILYPTAQNLQSAPGSDTLTNWALHLFVTHKLAQIRLDSISGEYWLDWRNYNKLYVDIVFDGDTDRVRSSAKTVLCSNNMFFILTWAVSSHPGRFLP